MHTTHTTSIDKFGRLLIPKKVRDNLGWDINSIIEIEETDHHLSLTAVDNPPALEMENGLLVYSGRPSGDLSRVLDSIREERLNDLGKF